VGSCAITFKRRPDRTPNDNADQGDADCQRYQNPMLAVVIEAQVHSLDQVVRPDATAARGTEAPFSRGDLSRPTMNGLDRWLKRKRWGAMGTRSEQKTTFSGPLESPRWYNEWEERRLPFAQKFIRALGKLSGPVYRTRRLRYVPDAKKRAPHRGVELGGCPLSPARPRSRMVANGGNGL
jgi:hypothetical protein